MVFDCIDFGSLHLPYFGQQYVVVVIPDPTHLLFSIVIVVHCL